MYMLYPYCLYIGIIGIACVDVIIFFMVGVELSCTAFITVIMLFQHSYIKSVWSLLLLGAVSLLIHGNVWTKLMYVILSLGILSYMKNLFHTYSGVCFIMGSWIGVSILATVLGNDCFVWLHLFKYSNQIHGTLLMAYLFLLSQ